MSKHPEQFTVEAWSTNAIAFIEEQGLTREFSDWCGGWPCPVDPKMVTAAPELFEALEAIVVPKCRECRGWGEVAYLGEMVPCKCRGQYLPILDPSKFAAARAAIAKARGEA